MPQELQVAASITSSSDVPFGQARTSVKLQIPNKSFNLISAEVVLEASEPHGIYVTVNGVKNPSLAGIVRRGGFLSICGQIWAESDAPPADLIQLKSERSNLTDTIERLANI